MKSRYIIIGSGPAGVAAIEAIRTIDSTGEILLISEEPEGYYSRPGLAYVLTGEIGEKQLFPFGKETYNQLNIAHHQGQVMNIFPEYQEIEVNDGLRFHFDRLLIATGATAVKLGIDGSDVEGVVKLDNIEDARRIIKSTRKGKEAVVVGGGITALEIVEGLISRRQKVHYFLRGDRYWSNVLDGVESRIIENRLVHDGVMIHYNTELAGIDIKGNRLAGVHTKDGRYIKCSLLAVAIGVRPRKELAEACGIQVDRGILVNPYMETNLPNIYAAGDVAQVYDPRVDKYILDSLWSPARNQGHVAGLNMVGNRMEYHKPIAFNVTRLAGLTTTIIGTVGKGSDRDAPGIVRGDSEIWRELPDSISAQSDFDVNRLRVIIGEETLLGAVVMGDQTLSRPLQRLVSDQINIKRYRDRLLQPDAPVADIIAEIWIDYQTRGKHEKS